MTEVSPASAHQYVQHRADQQATEDADGHVARRILGFLRGGGDGIESDVGEEHDARGAQYA